MSFPRDILVRYGGFSPDLGMQGRKIRLGEESHLFGRIQKHQPYFWYDPQLIVHHLVPRRNLRVGYRLRRAFASGRAVAYMRQEGGERLSRWSEMLIVAFFTKELFRALLFNYGDRPALFRKLCDLVKQFGVVSGASSGGFGVKK